MTDQVELQTQVLQLKSRVLDLQDQTTAVHQQNQELSAGLQKIAELLRLTPDENGNLALATIVSSIEDLVDSDDVPSVE